MVAARKLLTLCLERGISYGRMADETDINQFYLWNIVNVDGYEPPLWVRKRLGMREYRDLYAMPERELRWSLENREDYG